MSKFYQIVEKTEGAKVFTYNRDRYSRLVETLFPGRYLVSFQRLDPKGSIKDYRRCYFVKVDALAYDIGDTRYSLHDSIKEIIIQRMIEETPEGFNKEQPEPSTKYLNETGWTILLQRLDLWAFTEHNIILQ